MQKRLEAYVNGIRKLKKKEAGSGGKETKSDARRR